MTHKTPLVGYFLLTLSLAYPCRSENIFSMQHSLTIRCDPFPLIPTANDTDLQCARLRTDEKDLPADLDLARPTEITLFAIIDPPPPQSSPVNISLSFEQSSDSPSSINDIYLNLLVTGYGSIINNQTEVVHGPYSILSYHWRTSNESTFELIDELLLNRSDFEADTSLCKWSDSRWNRLFYGNASVNTTYVYFLKTRQTQLTFTLVDGSNTSQPLNALTPYLNILYCIPYRLGTTEIVLIICFGVAFITIVAILGILHVFKGGENDRTLFLERYQQRHAQAKVTPNSVQNVRQRSSAATSAVEHDD